MSVRVMAKIWTHGPSAQAERFVLLALADFANDAGECWPSIEGIAEKCCMAERSARRIIRRLEAGGWLETVVGGGRHGCNQYRINPDAGSVYSTEKPGPTVPPDRESPRTLSAENPDPECRKPGPTVPRTIKNHQEPSYSKNAREVRDALVEVATPEAADSFIAYRRRSKGKALTVTAAKRLAANLRAIFDGGGDPADALGMAEERGWLTIKPDWYFRETKRGGGRNARTDDNDERERRILMAAIEGTTGRGCH